MNSCRIMYAWKFCIYLMCTHSKSEMVRVVNWQLFGCRIDMVDIVLALVRASREGNWDLHLQSVHTMIPWLFAYDRVNYARYLPYYYASMTRLFCFGEI